ncbi:hypothetical protein BT93_H0496 [Corymbia citriodora subsp. variegata]|nr:hypothetical protein BT93_H0496 [Corymbia citriodora subsp. variegata]
MSILRCNMGKLPRLMVFIFFSLVILAKASASSDRISFNFTNFDPNDNHVHVEADATKANGAIQLSRNLAGENLNHSSGRATYYQPMHLWDKDSGNTADFTTQFTFTIHSLHNTSYADGLTFFLAPNGSQMPVRSEGGYLALVNSTNQDPSIVFIAVEFDTYRNPWDPLCEHTGIDINTVNSSLNVCVDWWKDNIVNGRPLHAQVEFDSSTQNLSVLLMDASDSSFSPNSSRLSYRVYMNQTLPEWVTFGFTASSGLCQEMHYINSWQFFSSLQLKRRKSKTRLWVVLGISGLLSLIAFAGFAWFLHVSKKGAEVDNDMLPAIDEDFDKLTGPKKFSYKRLMLATNNFTNERLLGQGGFGRVYKGYLSDLKLSVAIKRIIPHSKQGIKEYVTEVTTISQLRHKNLVQLVGWCHERKELLLIYEYMSNGSLDLHLFKERSLLTWEARYKIARDLAAALLYLHEEWAKCVVHRDIKCSNIILDSEFNAKLGDFGLARLVDRAKGSRTTILAGTIGYIDPAFVYSGRTNKASDVYSFGVVLLEIACGTKVVEPRAVEDQVHLVDWVRNLHGTEQLLDVVDLRLGRNFDEKEAECLISVGLWCTLLDHTRRPSMREVRSVLNFDVSLPVLPLKLPGSTYLSPAPPSRILSIAKEYGVTSSSEGSGYDTERSTAVAFSERTSFSAYSASLWNVA